MRIGHGYDVHRLVPDRKLILGGVQIPYLSVLVLSHATNCHMTLAPCFVVCEPGQSYSLLCPV